MGSRHERVVQDDIHLVAAPDPARPAPYGVARQDLAVPPQHLDKGYRFQRMASRKRRDRSMACS